jgi:hypothetical protein
VGHSGASQGLIFSTSRIRESPVRESAVDKNVENQTIATAALWRLTATGPCNRADFNRPRLGTIPETISDGFGRHSSWWSVTCGRSFFISSSAGSRCSSHTAAQSVNSPTFRPTTACTTGPPTHGPNVARVRGAMAHWILACDARAEARHRHTSSTFMCRSCVIRRGSSLPSRVTRCVVSAPGVTRTPGQRFRKPLLYPPELRGRALSILIREKRARSALVASQSLPHRRRSLLECGPGFCHQRSRVHTDSPSGPVKDSDPPPVIWYVPSVTSPLCEIM